MDPPETLKFFVRTITGATTAILASPSDTVEYVIKSLSVGSDDLRLLYRGRQLDGHCTLSESSIEPDSCLHLLSRLRSTNHPKACRIAADLLSSLFADRPSVNSILHRLSCFLSLVSQNDEFYSSGVLQVFLDSRAPAVLVSLYLSPKNSDVARLAIRLFFLPGSDHFRDPAHAAFGARILLELCGALRGTVGVLDPLYVFCRSALAAMVDQEGCMYWENPHSTLSSNAVTALVPFVEELVGEVVSWLEEKELTKDFVVHTVAVPYLRSLQSAIHNWMFGSKLEHKSTFLAEIACRRQFEDWMVSLHAIFMKLLEGVKCWLSNLAGFTEQGSVDESGWKKLSHPLFLIPILFCFSKVYEHGGRLICEVLMDVRVPLNAVLKRAKRDEDLHCLLGRKELVTDFEARRNLVSMLFPVEKDCRTLYEMLIDRSQLLAQSFTYISQAEANELHGALQLEFKNEEATGPGVVREWFCLLCQAIFSPQQVLFISCPNDPRRFYPNSVSNVDPLHLDYFEFSGRVIALALMHNVQVGIVFDRVFFLQLAGETVTLEDIQVADPTFYMSCKKTMEIDTELLDSGSLGLSFVTEIREMGTLVSVELCPGGKDIVVNSKNRAEYIDLLVKDRFVTSIRQQVSRFARGFSTMLPYSEHYKLFFQSLELEDFDLMLGGSRTAISVGEWKEHTKYKGYNAKDNQICWFWEIVEKMTDNQRHALLYFWTSVKYLPVDGFRGLPSKLQILRSEASDQHLPTAHTCFRQLCLPPYPSMSVMCQRLQFITQEYVSRSFGIL